MRTTGAGEETAEMMVQKLMLIVSVATLSAALPLAADTETVDGIKWTYTVANGVASIGGGVMSSTAVPTYTPGTIAIPSELSGCPVTSIGNFAFLNCHNITSVAIPESVTNIGGAAFSYCSSLTSVTIPDNVANIDESAFSRCSGLTNVVIGLGVTRVGPSG